jgi:hypothetical protein
MSRKEHIVRIPVPLSVEEKEAAEKLFEEQEFHTSKAQFFRFLLKLGRRYYTEENLKQKYEIERRA